MACIILGGIFASPFLGVMAIIFGILMIACGKEIKEMSPVTSSKLINGGIAVILAVICIAVFVIALIY